MTQSQQSEKSIVDNFLRWESASRDTIDFKIIYVDVAGDIISGLLLSQIVYWNLPAKNGSDTKLRVFKSDRYWLVKTRNDWFDECRITAKQFDRAIGILESVGVVECKVMRFNGSPTKHIWLNICALHEKIEEKWKIEEIGSSPKVNIQTDKKAISLTESTNTDHDQKLQRNKLEINQYTKHFQEKVCFTGDEGEFFKEDSLTKEEVRSHPSQQTKPTLDESTVTDSQIKTPSPTPSPRKSQSPIASLTYDDDGWLIAPTQGKYKLAGAIALRRMQYAIANYFIDSSYTFDFNDVTDFEAEWKGELLTWQEFEKDHPIGKLKNLALHDPAASRGFDEDWWNEKLTQFFLDAVEFCREHQDRAIEFSSNESVAVLFEDFVP